MEKVYSIYDSKSGLYDKPFLALNSAVIIREFETMANDPNSTVGKYPEDFTLFELGEYDNKTGKYKNHDTPKSMGVGIEFINKQN